MTDIEQTEPAARDSVWYKLSGKSREALERSIRASENGEELTQDEKKELATALGYYAPVRQTVCWFGPEEDYAVFPATFPHPLGQDEFYMKCPIGSTRHEEETHFEPEDGEMLSDEEADELQRILFPAWGGHVPITERNPIALNPSRSATPRGPGPS